MKYFLLISCFLLSSCTITNPFKTSISGTITPPTTLSGATLTGSRDIESDTGMTLSGSLTEIEWGVQTQISLSRVKANKENYVIDSGNGDIQSGAISPELWESLVSAINLNEFDALPEYPATFCPSCADSPEEFLTLTYNSGTKTVKYDQTLDTIPLLEPIRKILKNLSTNTEALSVQNEIQGIQLFIDGGLSCPNCIDTLKIYPTLVEYDKVTIAADGYTDTKPPASLHFSGALSEGEWNSIVDGISDEDFSELNTNPPPPDWEGTWLIITKNGLEKRYMLNEGISLNAKLSELFRKIEEIKKNIREQNTILFTNLITDTPLGEIQKISKNVSGMFGSITIDISSGSINIVSDIAGYNGSGAINNVDWIALTESINLQQFVSLNQKDKRFECKACTYDADNGESLTINYSGGTKVIGYGSSNTIIEIESIRNAIDNLAEKTLKQSSLNQDSKKKDSTEMQKYMHPACKNRICNEGEECGVWLVESGGVISEEALCRKK